MNLERTGPGRHGRTVSFTWLAIVVSVALPLIGVYTIAAARQHHWLHALVLTWYAVVTCMLLERAVRRGRRLDSFLALAAVNLLLLTPEITLRLVGFHYASGIRYGDSHPLRFVRLVEGENLFWTLPQGSPGVSPQGFKTRPLPADGARPPGRVRVVFLGDSVAYQGYPDIAETLLNGQGGVSYEVFNLSQAGYSSQQGRRVVERYGDAIAADIAVISYGWNDHWLAWGAPDSEKEVRLLHSPARRMATAVYSRWRLAQAVRYLVDPPPAQDRRLRVPPDQFRDNLTYLGEFWRERDTIPLFLTLPSSHPRLGVPDHLSEDGFANDSESVTALHQAYCGIVRQVTAEHGWPVLDLEAELAALDETGLRRIFLDDGIHLTTNGLALFAMRAAAAITELTPRTRALATAGAPPRRAAPGFRAPEVP